MGSPESRRKRKHALRAQSSFFRQKAAGRLSLPLLAVLCSIALMLGVCVRTALKRNHAGISSFSAMGSRDSTTPLAVLVREQHEISSQAAKFADPQGKCLVLKEDFAPQNLGPFTCVADGLFFVRAVTLALDYLTLILVDVGSPSPPAGGVVGAGTLFGPTTEQELNLELQGHVTDEEDPPTVEADVVLVTVHENRTAEDWSSLILKWLEATAPGGLLVVRSEVGWDGRNGISDGESPACDGRWEGSTGLREAVATLVCGDNAVSAAVGNFDGGILLVRHTKPGELPAERGCDRGSNGVKREGRQDALPESATKGPQSLRFEELFLWATGDARTGTIESVQAKFGGVHVIDHNARRRMSRSACFHSSLHDAQGKSDNTHAARAAAEKPRSQRAENPKRSSRGATKVTLSASIRSREDAVRLCLTDHLKEYKDDVRAAFAIEMIVQATGGHAKQRAISRRLREKVFAASGPTGELLWRRLYAHSAAGVAASVVAL